MSNQKTLELIIQELQSRIGQITSSYELQMAVLKANASKEIEDLNNKIIELGGSIAKDTDGK
jgi:hypothetical protein